MKKISYITFLAVALLMPRIAVAQGMDGVERMNAVPDTLVQDSARWSVDRLHRQKQFRTADSLDARFRFNDPDYTKPRPWRAAAEAAGINVVVHSFDRFILNEEFAETTFSTIGNNFRHAFVWDNDQFSTNLFAHPYHGNLYFNSARSNGLNFWQSAPYALAGSAMWEFFGEKEPPAINDLVATTVGGIAIGEITHRVSALILNDRSRGFRRFLREFAATVVNPMQGFNRIITGDAWKVRDEYYLYHDYNRIPVYFQTSFGMRYLADDGGLFRGESSPYLAFGLEYGDAFNYSATKPYDYFTMGVTFGMSANQPLINDVHLLGKLWSKPVYSGRDIESIFGIFQHFNYYDSKPVKDGTSLTPYRISEAASVGPGIIYRIEKMGALRRLEQQIYLDAILLGGTKSDYYNIIDRDYNMGSGYSVKSKLLMDFEKLGRLGLTLDYYQLFTWKGYEGKNLATVDPLYLNAQGDRGNARLLVLNTYLLFRLNEHLGMELGGKFFLRNTEYKYHDNVHAQTFDLKLGLTYEF